MAFKKCAFYDECEHREEKPEGEEEGMFGMMGGRSEDEDDKGMDKQGKHFELFMKMKKFVEKLFAEKYGEDKDSEESYGEDSYGKDSGEEEEEDDDEEGGEKSPLMKFLYKLKMHLAEHGEKGFWDEEGDKEEKEKKFVFFAYK
ncbi:protein bfr2-like, partial [Aplysia californica]